MAKSSYLRSSGWNIIDFTIVVSSWLTIFGSELFPSFKSFRILRALRPLRSAKFFKEISGILDSLLYAIPMLANVGILTMFFLIAFAVSGLEAFHSSYARRCVIDLTHDTGKNATLQNYSFGLEFPMHELFSVNATKQELETFPSHFCAIDKIFVTHVHCPQNQVKKFPLFFFFCLYLSSLFRININLASSNLIALYSRQTTNIKVFFLLFLFLDPCTIFFFFCFFFLSSQICDEDFGNPLPHISFDNFPQAMLLLFQVMSLDEWPAQLMHPLMESEYRLSYIYFIVAVILLVFLVVNLFVAVITTSFGRVREKEGHHKSAFDFDDIADSFVDDPVPASPLPNTNSGTKPNSSLHEDHSAANKSFLDIVLEVSDNASHHSNDPSQIVEADKQSVKNQVEPDSSKQKSLKRVDAAPKLEYIPDDLSWVESKPEWRKKLVKFVKSPRFENTVITIVTINCLFLSLESKDMSPLRESLLGIAELVFSIVFFGEMLIKIVALGPKRYTSSTANIIDGMIVALTTMSLVLRIVVNAQTNKRSSIVKSISGFRAFRVGRLMYKWERTRVLLQAVVGSTNAVLNIFGFMLFFVVVSAIFGMELFGGKMTETSPNSFNSFWQACFSVFQVMTGDQWTRVMADAYIGRQENGISGLSILATPLYFIITFMFGNYIILNLFIAVILENFSIDEETKRQVQEYHALATQEMNDHKVLQEAFWESLQGLNDSNSSTPLNRQLATNSQFPIADIHSEGKYTNVRDVVQSSSVPKALGDSHSKPLYITIPPPISSTKSFKKNKTKPGIISMDSLPPESKHTHSPVHIQDDQDVESIDFIDSIPDTIVFGPLRLTKNNFLRKYVIRIVGWNKFDNMILIFVIISCVFITLEAPHDHTAPLPLLNIRHIVRLSEQIFFIIFLMEFLLRIVAMGFKKYIRDGWNFVDFIVLLSMAISHISTEFSVGRSLRVGRILRPFRLLGHHSGMKTIINALWASLPSVVNVVILSIMLLFIYGIVGISIFSGQLEFCNDSRYIKVFTIDFFTSFHSILCNSLYFTFILHFFQSVNDETECIGTFFASVPLRLYAGDSPDRIINVPIPRVWSSSRQSFDNILQAVLTLVEV